MKKLLLLILLAGVFGLPKAFAAVPALNATVGERQMSKDGNGLAFTEDHFLGYKVFVATSSTAIQLQDESGALVTDGMVHAICLSSGAATTEWAQVYDSSAAFNAATIISVSNVGTGAQAGLSISMPIQRATATHVCQTLDAQFDNGAVILQSVNTGITMVYWRPAKGGSN